METAIIYEIIGYSASVLIAVSLMMTAIIKLRVINLIGAATFSLYGILIGAIPVAAMNGFIVLINIYYLSSMLGSKEYFKLLKVSPESDYLQAFIEFYKKEIQTFQPEFSLEPEKNDLCVFVLRDMVPTGLVIGEPGQDGIFTIKLDFVIPNYRDFKISRYLLVERKKILKEYGIKKLFTRGGNKAHRRYLLKSGFQESPPGSNRFARAL